MSLDEYKLSQELHGHTLDVRAVAASNEFIVSGSRDKTAKVWDFTGREFVERSTLKDHSNYISSVCVLEESQWICTGSNDSTVCVYTFNNSVPFVILRGHSSNVCAMSMGLAANQLVTGSWDKTARVWEINNFGDPTSIELKGHEAAVWAVTTLASGRYVTGSADKNIFIWNPKGEKVRVLKGHTDCVRGLLGLSNGFLVSVANDATVRYWNEDGDCIRELNGHNNYIYSVSLNRAISDDTVVTSSEDGTIRMWNLVEGELGTPIFIPAESVWTTVCLKNGDIVVGSSDGVVRVFTKDSSRVASESIMAAFLKAIEVRKAEANLELGGVKVNELPGPEKLLESGTEGQTKIIRHPDGKINCYQWSSGKWENLGDVTGAAGGTQATSGKKLFEGVEYDYVFSVDISDDQQPLKLPYNRGEDPWLAAQKFIHKNNLPQVYLDQVANFIVKNSDGAPVQSNNTPGYADPFTGGSRYVPGSGGNTFGNNAGVNLDPFTGGNSYTTTTSNQANNTKVVEETKHFPYSSFISLDTCDISKVLGKLKDFNSKVGDGAAKVTDEALEAFTKLAAPNAEPDLLSIETLMILLQWPKDMLFPVLDIVRLAIREQDICKKVANREFILLMIDNINHPPANQLMAIRCFSNMMNHHWGRGIVEAKLTEITNEIRKIHSGSVNLQIAIATFYLNASIGQLDMASPTLAKIIGESVIEFLSWLQDLESTYRSYQTIGNLLCTPYREVTVGQLISADSVFQKLKDNISKLQPRGFEKITYITMELINTV